MSIKHDEFFDELKRAVEEDRIILPTLPEVALRVRDVVEDENTTTEQIANILSQDPALSVRLLKVVNSPLYRGEIPIDDLHTAVTRMGGRLVRDLVINLAMKQMYQPTSKVMDKQFRRAWSTSVNVAAICQMMIASMCGIRKQQALLAGLIHNIGTLPLLAIVGSDKDLFNDTAELNSIIGALQGRIGAMMLKSWNFSDDLIEVVSECHNFNYDQKDGTNLVNLVQVALLQGGYITDKQEPDDWSLVPAFARLGMDTDVNVVQLEENQKILDDARLALAP